MSKPTRFQFGAESPATSLPVPAYIKRLKVGRIIVFCDRQFSDGRRCRRELAALSPIVRVGRSPGWELRPPRGWLHFDELPGGILRPGKEKKLTRRPVPADAMIYRVRSGRGASEDEHGRGTTGRAYVRLLLRLRDDESPPLLRCPTCGADNAIEHPNAT